MKLNSSAFQKVKEGSKTVEIRLYDEKRQSLKVGDEIEFRLLSDENETVRVKILELLKFPTFKELFAAFGPEQYGGKSREEYPLMYDIYSPEDEKKYGTLAIRIQRFDSE